MGRNLQQITLKKTKRNVKNPKKTITIGKHMGLSKNRLAQDLMVNHHTYENGHVGAYSIFRQTHIRKHSY